VDSVLVQQNHVRVHRAFLFPLEMMAGNKVQHAQTIKAICLW